MAEFYGGNPIAYSGSSNNLVSLYDPANYFSYSGSGSTINDISGANFNATLNNVSLNTSILNLGVSFYLNSNYVGFNSSAAITNFSGISSYAVGYNGISTTVENLNGNIGPIQIYNAALTQSQITQNFNAFRSRYGL